MSVPARPPSSIGPRLVALRARDPAVLVAALDATWAAGDAALPLDPSLPAERAEQIATKLGAAVIIDGGPPRALHGPVAVPEGTALVVRTSGSTGAPRAVAIDHAALRAAVRASNARLGAGPADRWLCCLPLHHIAGVLVVLRARALGHEPVLHRGFDPALIAAERTATHIALVPTMLGMLLDAGADVTRFRRILLGGAAPPPGLLERAAGARITVSYGMTETCGGCVYDGVPLQGMTAAVDPDGRVAIRGPMLASGSWSREGLQDLRRRGWLRTHDLGRWTESGRLQILGRGDDVLVTGGENVSADEVTRLLRAHPLIADAAVVGVADDRWGQRVVAYAVPRQPGHPPTLDDLRDHVRRHAGAASAPGELVLLAALPRTALGKIDRERLRAGGQET